MIEREYEALFGETGIETIEPEQPIRVSGPGRGTTSALTEQLDWAVQALFLENATMTQSEELWSPDRAASFLNLSVATLETWRAQGIGPRFIALSRKSIRYPASAILEFVTEREVIPRRARSSGSRKSVKVVNCQE